MKKFSVIAVVLLLAACSKAPAPEPAPSSDNAMQPAASEQPVQLDDGAAGNTTVQPGNDIPLLSGMHNAVLHTPQGDITLELNADVAPMAVTNFVMLAQAKLFDRIEHGIFKVEPGMLFQAGDLTGDGKGASIFGKTFQDENVKPLEAGDVAMVNDGPDSNGSAFMIVTADSGLPWLRTFTVFGKVTGGMEAAKAIANTQRNEETHAPLGAMNFTVDAN